MTCRVDRADDLAARAKEYADKTTSAGAEDGYTHDELTGCSLSRSCLSQRFGGVCQSCLAAGTDLAPG